MRDNNKANQMYNSDLKEKFLEYKGYSEETKRVCRILFGKVAKYENEKQLDISQFDKDSFAEVLNGLKATTIRSLQSSISTVEQYISYCIALGKTTKNVASFFGKSEDIIHFLDKKAVENMIFTKSEIESLSGYSENAQDGVILNLLFDGISHKRKFLELRNIRIQDCDFDTMVIYLPQLVDEDTGEILPERQVPISAHTRVMIQSAMAEVKYASIKGESKRLYKIAESDYILRGLRNNFQIKSENVNQRILRIAKIEGYDYLNATNIAYSGQIHYAIQLMDNGGIQIDEACKIIMKRFNINKNDAAFFYLKARIENVIKKFG